MNTPIVFRARENFDCPELGSAYVQGLTYTVRPGADRLAARVREWAALGRVEIVQQPGGRALAGTGNVT